MVFSTNSYADSAIGKGSKEVNVQWSMAYEQRRPKKVTYKGEEDTDLGDGEDSFLILGSVGGGYFVTDWVQLGGAFVTSYNLDKDLDNDSTNSTTSVGIDFNPKFHFYKKGQSIIPYIGCVFRPTLDTHSGPHWTLIPVHTGHLFRSTLDTYSGTHWTPIPVHTGHPFRCTLDTCSG